MVLIMSDELYHYGLKGMKWGQRRWQYDDGRFNDAGKQRYFGQNSSHRPDSVRVLQGDKPKNSGSEKSSGGSKASAPKKEFDKEHAKEVAKKAAIGAAIVGGTVLVAYGGYKLHQAGGFSGVSKNLTAKMRETKLENLKLKQDFKAEVASIKGEGKQNLAQIKADTKKGLAQIRENTKTEFAKIREEGKLDRDMFKLDPEERIDKNILKELASGSSNQNGLKDKLKSLDSAEVAALNSGKVKLSDLQGRRARDLDSSKNIGRSIMDASRHSKEFNGQYDSWLKNLASGKATRDDRPIPDASTLMDNPVTKSWWQNSHGAAVNNITSNATTSVKKAGSAVAKAATSDATKSAVKSAGTTIRKAGSAAVKAATSDTAKATYKKAGNAAVKAAKTGASTTAKAAKSTARIVADYRKAHPNTRMSPQQIVKSVSGQSSGSSRKSGPKLTLNPETMNAGANLLGQATKSYVTIKQVNAQNANNKKVKRGQNAVDNYTQQLLRGA